MELPRYREPVFNQKINKLKVVRPSSQSNFDDTTTSIKENANGSPVRRPSPNFASPTEEVLINFQTELPIHTDTQSPLGPTNTVEGQLLSRVTTAGGMGERALTTGEDLAPISILEDDVVLRLISTLMFYVLRINTLSFGLFGLITLMITWEISFIYPIGFLWIVDFFELLQMTRHSRKYKSSAQTIVKKIILYAGPFVKTFSFASSKGLLLLYLNGSAFPLALCFAPMAAYELIGSLLSIYRSKEQGLTRIYKSFFVFKLLLTLMGLTVSMKYEGMLTWEWRETLISYWIIFSLLCGFSLVAVLCLINRCCVFFFADSEHLQVHGVIWAVLILAGKATLSCILVINLRNFVEQNLPIQTLLTPFLMIMTYNLAMLLFTLGYYTEIESFFKYLAAIEDEIEPTTTYGMETKENQPKILQKIVVPKFLTKSSSTYYRRATDNEIKENKQRRKKRQDKERVKPLPKPGEKPASKKITKHSRQKSADQSEKAKEPKPTPDKAAEDSVNKTKPDLLLTIAETDQDKGTLPTDLDKTGKSGREDKGKNFFSQLSNRNGVLGIVPNVARKLGLKLGVNKEYAEYENEEGEEDHPKNYGNQSYDVAGRGNRSPKSSSRGAGNLTTLRLRKLARGQIEGKGLTALEDKLKALEDKNSMDEKAWRDRMTQSMHMKPHGNAVNLSGVFEHVDLNDSSVVDESFKPKSGDNSMTQQCLICFDKQPDAVFMECGHGGVCYECAVEIWKATEECYLCRNKIIQVLQIDLKSKLDNVIKVISSTQMVNWDEAGK